jgi:glutamate dehydrogenase (NAD(P)+)
VGISNGLGTLEARDGLDVPWLIAVREQGGDEAVAEAGRQGHTTGLWTASPDQLLTLAADLFVPAARTAAFALPGELPFVRREENADAADVLRFCRNAGIRLVAEAANHPLTAGAEAALHSEGVTILPDVLVNCGGFIGCWVEWKLRNEASGANAREDGASCVARTRRTVRRNVQAFLAVDGSPRSTAKALARQARERLQASAREGSAPQSG